MASILIHIQFLLYLMRYAASQYGYHDNTDYENPVQQQYYQSPDRVDYEPHMDYRRQWMRSKKKQRKRESDEDDCSNKCSCNKCDYPIQCCVDICNYSCNNEKSRDSELDADMPIPPVPPITVPSSLVFVPYPYPLVVPGNPPPPPPPINDDSRENITSTPTQITSTTTTTEPIDSTTTHVTEPSIVTTTTTEITTTTTTEITTTTTTTPVVLSDIEIAHYEEKCRRSDDDLFNLLLNHARKNIRADNDKYVLSTRRRTRPTWVPKYGIIPIPDKLSERLMSQLRQVKGYNYRRKS